jgi:hypothetical protein
VTTDTEREALSFHDALQIAEARFQDHAFWNRLDGTPWGNDAPVIAAILMVEAAGYRRAAPVADGEIEGLVDGLNSQVRILHGQPAVYVGDELAEIFFARCADYIVQSSEALTSAQRENERLRVIPDALETLVVFFEAHATGPGERTYTVAEIAQTVRDWIADAQRIAALSPAQKTEGEP